MAEEFADLTNSRVNDERYANNVIFDEAGLSELLTHIKNYPIIDVEYIDENDKDAIHTDKKVWETYTEGTPCIKITFGDEENKTGNLTPTQIQELKGLKQDLELYSGVQSIYNKYKSVESEYKGLIRNLKDELQQIINNVYTVYYNYIHNDNKSDSLHDTSIHWTGKYYDLLLDANKNVMRHFRQDSELEGSDTGFIVDKFYYKITFEIADFTNEAVLDNFIKNNNSITDVSFYTTHYSVFDSRTDMVNKDCIVPFKGYVPDTNPERIEWTIEVGDKAAISNAPGENYSIAEIQNQFDHYNDLLIKTLQMLSNDYVQVQTNATFDSNITYYILDNQDIYQKVDINDFVAGTTYYYRAGNDNNHIRNLLRQYINYIRESRVNCYEEIRKFLIANDKTETVLQTKVEEFDTNPNSIYQKLSTHIDKTYRKSVDKIQEDINTLLNSAYEQMGENAIQGYKYVKVGSNITFDKNYDIVNEVTTDKEQQKFGTYRMTINGHTYEVPIKGFGNSSSSYFQSSGSIIPNLSDGVSSGTAKYDLGSSSNPWRELYVTTISDTDGNVTLGNSSTANFVPGTSSNSNLGSSTKPWTSAYITTVQPSATSGSSVGTSSTPYAIGYFNQISVNSITGTLAINSTANGTIYNSDTKIYSGNTAAAINTSGGIYAAKNIWGAKVFNAVFNDYAECRTTINLAPGHVVIDNDDGSLSCSSQRLQPGAQVISDTYGHLMGGTENATTPIAVAGRVLVYTYQSRDKYHAGMAVCSAPGGTVDIMTREEIKNYPDCIVGIVSEIPEYEYWGTDNVKVDSRIWIKIK